MIKDYILKHNKQVIFKLVYERIEDDTINQRNRQLGLY